MFDYCTVQEAEIACRLVRELLRRSYSISIHDSEELVLHKSKDEAEIFEALNSSEYDTVIAFDGLGKRSGAFVLIWGNGEDLLSDYTANDFCDEIFEILYPA